MRLTIANKEAIKYACLKFHYAKAIPVNTLGYNVYNDADEWCGVILYGAGANVHLGTQYELVQGSVFELVRVALNGKQECTSKAVAMSLKQLKKDCPLCRLVISYADCDQNHLGTIYQATNWIYTGKNNEDTAPGFIVNGKKTHRRTISSWIMRKGGLNGLSTLQFLQKYFDPKAEPYITKGKRKYLMPMDKKMRKQIEPLRQPYPKTDADWQKIDRNKFKHEQDGTKEETN